jgi:hypothetical protein
MLRSLKDITASHMGLRVLFGGDPEGFFKTVLHGITNDGQINNLAYLQDRMYVLHVYGNDFKKVYKC